MHNQKYEQVVASIVIATGNDVAQLELSLNSVISQTVFNVGAIEVIVVNNSYANGAIEEVCREYIDKYGELIKYIEALEVITPEAFNKGRKVISGRYVNFIMAGSRHHKQVVEKIIKVFEENEEYIDLVAAPIKYDGGEREFLSRLNYKSNKVIDLEETPQKIQISVQNTFIKVDAIEQIYFNNTYEFTYEIDFVIKILNIKKKYRTMKGSALTTCHYYDDLYTSTIVATNKRWYEELIKEFLPQIMSVSKKENQVERFIQLSALYLIQWRFLANQNSKDKKVFLGKDLDEFFYGLKEIFSDIEDAYILNYPKYKMFKSIARLHIIWVCIKEGRPDINNMFACQRGKSDVVFSYKDILVTSFNAYKLQITLLEYKDGTLNVHAVHTGPFNFEECELYVTINGNKYKGIKSEKYELQKYFGKSLYKNQAYCFEIPLDEEKDQQRLGFYLKYKDKKVKLKLKFTKPHARLSTSKMKTYWRFNKYIAEYNGKDILILKTSKKRILKREVRLCWNLLRRGNKSQKKAALLRSVYWATRPLFAKKPIWITYDKLYKGGDNGEYFARYVTQKDKNINMYYLVSKGAEFKEKLKKDGIKVIEYGTLKHRLLFLNADLIFTTHTGVYNFNGFGMHIQEYFRDLTRFDIICIQHGLTVQKFAHSLNKDFDDTKRFYCASRYEIKDNLAKPIYGYNLEDLRLTGSPRYDGLINNDKKQILISPTWRQNIAMPSIMGQPRPYNPQFKLSSYYKVYNELVNNKQLINKAREKGYKLIYLVHPTFSSQIDDYDKNDYVEIIPASGDISYEKILTESSLLVTDYSGIQFDFAYMKKPLLYFHHHDIPPHYEEGCFYYDTMAFGDICTTTQDLIEELCGYMDNVCKMKEEYVKRVDDFFEYNDHNNSQRIYEDVVNQYINKMEG